VNKRILDALDALKLRTAGPKANNIQRIQIDSRKVQEGDAFVALPGERVDGHDYIPSAIQSGAKLVLCKAGWKKPEECAQLFPEVSFAFAEDVLRAMQDWAKASLKTMTRAKRVGITGSNGKTTTKELLAAILRQVGTVYANPGNYNSDIGLPLSVLSMDAEPDFMVLEMGMNRRGEMKELADVYFPQLGLITNIGTAHIGIIGSQEGIALEKRAIFSNANRETVAVLPGSDPYFELLKENFPGEVQTFSDQDAQELSGLHGFEGMRFFWEGNEYRLPLSGKHNVNNALAAMTAARVLGASPGQIARGLAEVRIAFGRGEFLPGPVAVYQDCYNANPDSMLALLGQLEDLEWAGQVHLVLGEMRELGDQAEDFHRALAKALPVDRIGALYLFGGLMQGLAEDLSTQGFSRPLWWTEDFSQLSTWLGEGLKQGDLVILKGSRGVALERLTKMISSDFPLEVKG
jgi:UDP-N-acetylmuramoyl-tripeptide--D-alanyl-D-alanine ligase